MNLKKYFDKFWDSVRGSPSRAKQKDRPARYLHVSKVFRKLTDKERVPVDPNGQPTGVVLPEFWAERGKTYDVGRNKIKAKRKVSAALSRAIAVKRAEIFAGYDGIPIPRTPKIKYS